MTDVHDRGVRAGVPGRNPSGFRIGFTDPLDLPGRCAAGFHPMVIPSSFRLMPDLGTDRSVREAASWRLASQLVQRHPKMLRILRTHPFDGMYDCLSIRSRFDESMYNSGAIDLNRNGSIHVLQRFDGRHDDTQQGWPQFPWDSYLDANPRRFVEHLELMAGLPKPQITPAATPATLTYRLLATIAATATKSTRPIDIQSGFIDFSGPNAALDLFPAIPAVLRRPSGEQPNVDPGYRFWVVLRARTPLALEQEHPHAWIPVLALEQEDGLAWTRHHPMATQFMHLYQKSGRDEVATALELLRLAFKK